MYWHNCEDCNGIGTKVVKFDYEHNTTIEETCDSCGGEGGYYMEGDESN